MTSSVVKKELHQKAKLSIYWSINITTPIYGHNLEVVTKTNVAVYSQLKYVASAGWWGAPFEIG